MDYPKLSSLFIHDPKIAILESQKLLCAVTEFQSYENFNEYHQKNAHISTCPNEWSSSQLCIYCRDCSVINPSCICLPCFLNGDHEGHNYVILNSGGNCDCGDLSQWKSSGCCPKHRGLSNDDNNPEDYLDVKLRTTLVDVIFKAAFESLSSFSKSNSENASYIIQFASSFLKYGDGFRRLIAQSLTEKIDFESLLMGIPSYSTLFNESLQQLCGGLVNDQLFIRNFSRIGYKVISNGIIKHTHEFLSLGSENITYSSWENFWFHIFSKKNAQYSILHDKWNWVEFFTECLDYFKDVFDFIKDDNYKYMSELLMVMTLYLPNVTECQPNEQTQLMLDNLATKILSCGSKKAIKEEKNNTIVVTCFNENSERGDYFPVFHFIVFFYCVFSSFKNKPNLKFETLIDELDETFDISSIFKIDDITLENYKLIKSIYNQKSNVTFPNYYYNSFHNGGSFFLSHPLLHSLVSLFKNDNITRIKIANLLSKEKYQDLRIRVGIAVLKTILSNVCYRQSLVSLGNHGVNFVYDLLCRPNSVSNYFTKFFPVFQLIIGIRGEKRSENDEFSLKEFFAFEIAREIGFFDDFTSENYKSEKINEIKKQMIFSFLYLSLLFVIERTLFNFNGNDFIQEQFIFELKKGVHSIDALDKSYDKDAIENWSHLWIFNYILMKIATSNKMTKNKEENDTSFNNKDVSFYLKDDVEWNPISAINSINDQMTLMNNEISKNSDNLIKIQNFIDEEKYFFHPRKMCKDEILDYDYKEEEYNENDVPLIHLKEFLFTPTVLAIVYHTLRTNTGTDSPKSDINDHLAMNILVLISRFVKENNNNKEEEIKNQLNESMIIHYDSLIDLISKLKKNVFNFNGISIIENNLLNQKNFVSLMKLKIGSNDLHPKSFIDVLLSKGKLGINVLNEISNNVHLDCVEIGDHKQEDVKEINRQKAKKLKDDIMNHYKTMISNYNVSEHQIDEVSSVGQNGPSINENEVCSICSIHKKNEIFSYPLYIYRTKFPFIIDKPPLISKDTKGISIDDNIEDFDQEKDNKNDDDDYDDEEEEEEEEEESISTDNVMSMLMNQFPQLTETEGLSEEDIEERQNTLSILFDQFLSQQIHSSKQRQHNKSFIKKANQLQKKEDNLRKQQNKNNDFKRCTAGVNFVLQFGICQHPIHLSCIKSKNFTCPIDRSKKNGFLPSVDGIPASMIFKDLNTYEPKIEEEEGTIAHNIINAISIFIKNCESFFKCTKRSSIDIFIELIKSLSALISTYEIRLRNLPDCLDSNKTKILARNLFLTVWYGYRIQKKPKMVLYENEEEDCETRMSTFQRFIKRLIECDKIENDFGNIVSFFVDSINKNSKNNGDRKEKELCLFLRRVCLAEFFLLNQNISEISNGSEIIIDWDEILSPQNLSQRYEVTFETLKEFEFKPFTFLDLPKQFLSFAAPPFNFHIEKIEELSFFNLIDYNYLINNYDELTGQISHLNIEEELKRNSMNLCSCDENLIKFFLESFFARRHQPSIILFVKKYASQVFLIDQGYFADLSPFYLDKYGCNDIGYKRSQPLFFNEAKYEKLIDTILSGDFSYSLIDLSVLE